MVLRVLDRSSVNLNMDNLGLPAHIHEYILDTVHKPNGIFIVTGPTRRRQDNYAVCRPA